MAFYRNNAAQMMRLSCRGRADTLRRSFAARVVQPCGLLTERNPILHILRFTLHAIPVAVWLLLGLAIVTLVFPLIPARWRSLVNRGWSRILIAVCGVRVRVLGAPVLHAPVLWVANHVSWLDIFCLNSVRSTAFVAKHEIRRWPIIGWLAAAAGTIFIERGNRQTLHHVGEQMQQRLRRGEAVGLFPEGTTSDGFDVGPFHTSLFDAAIRAHTDIQAVALRFYHRGKRSDLAAFVGDQTLIANLWHLLGTKGVQVEIAFLPPHPAAQCQALGRHGVAQATHGAIRQALLA